MLLLCNQVIEAEEYLRDQMRPTRRCLAGKAGNAIEVTDLVANLVRVDALERAQLVSELLLSA
jgi:hypothetical protein